MSEANFEKAKPSPAPWRKNAANGFHIHGRNGQLVAVAQGFDLEAEANAEFICRAANSHDALVEALTIAQQWLVVASIGNDDFQTPLATVRAALAKATGQGGGS